MVKEVRLPQLGQTMEEATIVNCLVKIGDEVKKGDIIFEVETDKAVLEMESPADGFVKHILAETGQTLPVGTVILILADKDEEVPQSFVDSLKGGMPVAETAFETSVVEPTKPQTQPAQPVGRIIASPRAKKLAKELGVDLTTVKGTATGGRITEQDVRKAAASESSKSVEHPVTEPAIRLGETVPLSRLQKITAQRMLQSKGEIPCFYLTATVDMTALVELRTRLNETSEVKLSYNDFIMRAIAIAMEEFPLMAGQLVGDTVKLADSINIGLAVSVPDGLVAPVVKDVQRKDVVQIARESKALIEKARNNKLAPADLEGGCITITNLGAFGIKSFIAIVVPGQCSILGIGQITDTCVPKDGNIMVRKLMDMTLSVDHRIVNGMYAAQFLGLIKKVLENTSNFG